MIIYAVGCCVGAVFVFFVLQETTGKSLDDIGTDEQNNWLIYNFFFLKKLIDLIVIDENAHWLKFPKIISIKHHKSRSESLYIQWIKIPLQLEIS